MQIVSSISPLLTITTYNNSKPSRGETKYFVAFLFKSFVRLKVYCRSDQRCLVNVKIDRSWIIYIIVMNLLNSKEFIN